jgi:hypothetical protein
VDDADRARGVVEHGLADRAEQHVPDAAVEKPCRRAAELAGTGYWE